VEQGDRGPTAIAAPLNWAMDGRHVRTLRLAGMSPVRAVAVVSLLVGSSSAWASPDCDDSDRAAGRLVTELGRLNAKDDANHTDYGFVVCETYNVFEQKGRISVVSSAVTGTIIEVSDVNGLSEDCVGRGAPYSPTSASDPRRIEYRLCRDRVEVAATVLDKKGAPKAPQLLKVALPDLKARPAKYSPFPAGSSFADKQVVCDDGEKTLGKLDAKDEANLTVYRFVVCQKKDRGISVRSNFLTGTDWSASAVADQAGGNECVPSGAPYGQQGPGDARAIAYKLCGRTVEVSAVTLDANWSPHPIKKLAAPIK
jgi:hypothetical protein